MDILFWWPYPERKKEDGDSTIMSESGITDSDNQGRFRQSRVGRATVVRENEEQSTQEESCNLNEIFEEQLNIDSNILKGPNWDSIFSDAIDEMVESEMANDNNTVVPSQRENTLKVILSRWFIHPLPFFA